MNILMIYQFCTFGGVERVILNRATAFLKYGLDFHISVGYLYDHGALSSFRDYISLNGLSRYLSAFLLSSNVSIDFHQYDLVLNIDTPQVLDEFSDVNNMFIECHTPYPENRQYLKRVPKNIKGIIVPSFFFKRLLEQEISGLPEIFVHPNPVPNDFFEVPLRKTIYPKNPIAYLARLDEMKNYTEAVEIFSLFSTNEKIMYAIVGKGVDEKKNLQLLRSKKILSKTFWRQTMSFNDIPSFIGMIKDHRGVFFSPSRGESFGLSAAEFMSAGVPVLLSNIDAHRELVENDERFLYPLGDVVYAKTKIENILNNWEISSLIVRDYACKFKEERFMQAWNSFVVHNF